MVLGWNRNDELFTSYVSVKLAISTRGTCLTASYDPDCGCTLRVATESAALSLIGPDVGLCLQEKLLYKPKHATPFTEHPSQLRHVMEAKDLQPLGQNEPIVEPDENENAQKQSWTKPPPDPESNSESDADSDEASMYAMPFLVSCNANTQWSC